MSQGRNGRQQVCDLAVGQRFYTGGGDVVRILNFQSCNQTQVVFESGPHEGRKDTVSSDAWVVPVRGQ